MSYDRFKKQKEDFETTQKAVEDYYRKKGLDEWGYPVEQPEMVLSPQEEIAERNRAYAKKWNDVNSFAKGVHDMNADDWLEVGGQALQGAERVASGASFGAYDWLNRKAGGNYKERKEELQRAADNAGIGLLNTLTGAGMEIAGNIAGGGTVLARKLANTGLKGTALASAAGGIDGLVTAGFKTENPQDLAWNMLQGGVAGTAAAYGMDKAARGAINRFGPVLEKHFPKFAEISNLRRGATGDAGLDDALGQAGNMQRSGTVPTEYAGDIREAAKNASLQNEPLYKQLEQLGDMEVYEIANQFKNITPTQRTVFNVKSKDDYVKILMDQGKMINQKFYENGASTIKRILKEDGRRNILNTLSSTYNTPDVSAINISPEGMPVKYFMKKYTGNTPGDLYDMVVQNHPGEIFTKIPSVSPTYVAREFKGPLQDLSVSNRFLQDTGIDPELVKSGNLSEIGKMVRSNEDVQAIVNYVKQRSKKLDELPDTSFRVLNQAGKTLKWQENNVGGKVGEEAAKTANKIYEAMDRITPRYGKYRRNWDASYNQELAKMLAQRDLEAFAGSLNFNRGTIDPAVAAALGAEVAKYWVK